MATAKAKKPDPIVELTTKLAMVTADRDVLKLGLHDAMRELARVKGTDVQPVVLNITWPESKKLDLKDFKANLLPLTQPHHFDDDDEYTGQFTKAIVITRREFKKEFLFQALHLFLDDNASVTGQAAKCWFVKTAWFAYDTEMVPVLLSVFTSADVESFLDVVIDANSALSADDLRTIHMETLARLVVNMQADVKKFRDQLETAKAFEDKANQQMELLRKKVRHDLVRLDNKLQGEFDRYGSGHRLSTAALVALGSGWLAFVVVLGWLIGVVT
jgi:hypothetical protein